MFWRDAKHIMLLIILGLTVIDICIYTSLKESGVHTVRWSRPLRSLLIVNIPEGEYCHNQRSLNLKALIVTVKIKDI